MEKNKLGSYIDSIGKTVSRAKTMGVLVLAGFFCVSLVQNGCDRERVAALTETLTGLDVQNSVLLNSITSLDSTLIAKQDSINMFKDSALRLDQQVRLLNVKYRKLYKAYERELTAVDIVSVDSSYTYLTQVAYPFIGEPTFKFNKLQVKGIHRTFLLNKGLSMTNTNLKERNGILKQELSLYLSVQEMEMSKSSVHRNKEIAYSDIIENKDVAISAQEEELKKQGRNKKIRNIAVVTGTFILGFLIGN